MKDKKLLKRDFSKILLKKIKKEDIKQVPKYIFILKNISIWFFLIFSVIIGAISLSISFEYLINADWSLINRIGIIKILTIFMPLFWIFFLIGASFLSYFNFRHTERGYKYSFGKILGINILFSIILGFILYITGINHFIELKMEESVPKYRGIFVESRESRMIKVWQNEESGLLIGKIIDIKEGKLDFVDYNNKKWNILLNQDTNIKRRVVINKGEMIKIIGKEINNNNFKALEIRPFIGKMIISRKL